MKSVVRSLVTAILIATFVQCFAIGLMTSSVPRVVGRPDFQEVRQMQFPAATLVRLENEDGSVQVRPHELDEISVQASVRAYARSSSQQPTDLQGYLSSLVHARIEDNVLSLVTEPMQRPDDLDIQVDYVVLVPEGTDVAINGGNGNVWIAKGCGKVSVRGKNTDIEVFEPEGSVLAESTNGRVRVLNAPQGATIRTVNGSVYAHMKGGTLDASTTNGAIVARVLDGAVQECRLKSQNGGITLVMRDTGSARIDAKTGRGAITSDFPVNCADGVQLRRYLRGSIGKGDTMLQLETLNGNIWIARSET